MELTVSSTDTTAGILERLGGAAGLRALSDDRASDCCVIIDEFHANMRAHVWPASPGEPWQLSVTAADGTITMAFRYRGPCFDPSQGQPVKEQPIEYRRIGGLGLAIIAELSDHMDYSYQQGLNTLTVTLHAPQPPKEDDHVVKDH